MFLKRACLLRGTGEFIEGTDSFSTSTIQQFACNERRGGFGCVVLKLSYCLMREKVLTDTLWIKICKH